MMAWHASYQRVATLAAEWKIRGQDGEWLNTVRWHVAKRQKDGGISERNGVARQGMAYVNYSTAATRNGNGEREICSEWLSTVGWHMEKWQTDGGVSVRKAWHMTH
jgi:hypothetical protein